MILTDAQIEKFKEVSEKLGISGKFSDESIRAIANGVANYYLTLFKVYMVNLEALEGITMTIRLEPISLGLGSAYYITKTYTLRSTYILWP